MNNKEALFQAETALQIAAFAMEFGEGNSLDRMDALNKAATVYAAAKARFLDNIPNPDVHSDRNELAFRLKLVKHKYDNRKSEGFSDQFVSGYQQGLAEARDVIKGEDE